MTPARGSRAGGRQRREDNADVRRNPVSSQPESVLSEHTVRTIANRKE